MSHMVTFPVVSDDCNSLGRNGYAKTTAVELWQCDRGTVRITPITGKGALQRCEVEMTTEAMTAMAVDWLSHLAPEEIANAVKELTAV